MNRLHFERAVLLLAGLIGLTIGSGITFTPFLFYRGLGFPLAENPNLLSELRAGGGFVLLASLFITAGAFVRPLAFSARVLAAGFYLSYGLSRGYSYAIDGAPALSLIQAGAVEIVVGLLCLLAPRSTATA
jgi:Domain of unknown function (DUF4345)